MPNVQRSGAMTDRESPAVREGPDREQTPREHGEAPPKPTFVIRLLTEVIGAFALTFVAAGGDAAARLTGGEVTPFARALAPGLLVMALIYAIGDRSGAHFNPAVTLAFTLRRLFPPKWLVPYWIAQLAGAIAAAALLRVLLGDAAAAGVTSPKVVEPAVAAVIEVLLTAILVTVILGTADRYELIGPNAAIPVGATIALCGLVALPIEGASMNPARSAGPALISGDIGSLWIYVVGPVIGALAAVLLARLVHGPTPAGQLPREAAMGSR
jgi:MIP family channel proteins